MVTTPTIRRWRLVGLLRGTLWGDHGCPDSDSDGSSDPWDENNPYGTQYIWAEEGCRLVAKTAHSGQIPMGMGMAITHQRGPSPDKFPAIPAAALT
ncbi:MAG: hypothetical protein CM15mP9_4430 [Methanobacteriota archaeon]|nr:MAG: hypothetical protein CM15mP9_4430 [Euryarchaeota archaeon]